MDFLKDLLKHLKRLFKMDNWATKKTINIKIENIDIHLDVKIEDVTIIIERSR